MEIKVKGLKQEEPKTNGHPLLASVFDRFIIRFNIGASVYLKTDDEQRERLVTGINIRENGISYAVAYGVEESWHYAFEITKEKDVVKATSS